MKNKTQKIKLAIILILLIFNWQAQSQQYFSYFEDFENGNGGWTTSGANSSWAYGRPTSGPNSAYSGTKLWATNLSGNYNSSENSYLTSPTMDMTGLNGKLTLSFALFFKIENQFDYTWLEYTTDGTTWTKITSSNATVTNWYNFQNNWSGENAWSGENFDVWREVEAEFSSFIGTSTVQFRVAFHSDGSSNKAGVYVDDFSVANCVYDGNPVAVSNITADSADVVWSANSNNFNYEYRTTYLDTISNQYEEITAWTTKADTNVRINLSGTPRQMHKFELRMVCNSTAKSKVVSVTFTSECATSYTVPFFETFEAEQVDYAPKCWTSIQENVGISGGLINTNVSSSSPKNGLHSVNLFNNTSDSGFLALASPLFTDLDDGTDKLLSFYHKNTVVVGTMSDISDTTTFVSVDTVVGTDNWDYKEVLLNNVTVGHKYIVFVHPQLSSDVRIYIDDVIYNTAPSCYKPVSLTIFDTNIKSSNIDVEIINDSRNNVLTNYEYQLKIVGNNDTLYETFSGMDDTLTHTIAVLLKPFTDYNIYARAICSVGDTSVFIKPESIRTRCTYYTAPYSESFDNLTNVRQIPECWFQIRDEIESGVGLVASQSNNKYSPPYSIEFDNNRSTSGKLGLCTPALWDIGNGDKYIKFRLKRDGGAGIYVALMKHPDSLNSIIYIDTFDVASRPSNTTEWEKITVYLDNVPSGYKHIAFFHTLESSYDKVYIDDFRYEVIPTCLPVVDINIDDVSSDTVAFSWGNNLRNASVMRYEYKFIPLSSSFADTTATSITDTNAVVRSLMPNTNYKLRVRVQCSATDYSEWSDSVVVRTDYCGTINTFPYIENFTDFFDNFEDKCWDRAGNGNPRTGPMDIGASDWEGGTLGNNGTSGAVKVNLFNTSHREWLISEKFNFMGNINYQLELDFAFVRFNNKTARVLGSDDTVQVLVTVDTGATWTDLYTWTAANTGVDAVGHIILDLTTYTGISNVRFAIWASDGTIDNTEDIEVSFDNFKIKKIPSCLNPTNLVAYNITTSSASFTFDTINQGFVNFEYKVNTSIKNTTILDSINLTGLTGNTEYKIVVRQVCSADDTSNWTNTFKFVTKCTAISTFPWTEGFETTEGGNIPRCFERIDANQDGDQWKIFSSSSFSRGYKCVAIRTDYNRGDNNDYLILPAMNLSNNQYLKFWVRALLSGEPNDFQILISSTDIETSSFTDTILPLTVVNYTAYREYKIDLSAYSGVTYIAFHIPSGGLDGYYLYIDDLEVGTYPPCRIPNIVEINNIKSTSFTLDWASPNIGRTNNDSLLYVYTLDNTLPANAIDILGDSSSIQVSGVTGVTQDTVWNIFVREVCSTAAGDTSAWVGPISFKTPCNSVISSFPWIENFEGVSTPNLPDCFIWLDNLNINSTNHWESSTTNPNGASTKSAHVNTNQGKDYIILPQFTLTGNERLVYWVKNSSSSSITNYAILVSTNGVGVNDFTDTIFTQSLTALGGSSYAKKTINLDGYTGNVFIAFYIPQGSSGQLYIDDIIVEQIPICLDVENIMVDDYTSNSVTLSWASHNSTQNVYYYVLEGNQTLANATVGSSSTGSPLTINNLNPDTNYTIYLRELCSATDTSQLGNSIMFNTLCNTSITVGWVEDFEDVTTPELPSCFVVIDNNEDGNKWETDTISGNKAAKTNNNSNTGNNDDYLILPQVDASATDLELWFHHRVYSSSRPNDFYVLLSTDGVLPADFTDTLFYAKSSNTFYDSTYVYILQNTEPVHIAFYIPNGGLGLGGWNLYLDNLSLKVARTCKYVQDLELSYTSSDSVAIGWNTLNSVTPANYQVINVLRGQNIDNISPIQVSTNSVSIGDLSIATNYTVYIRQICSSGDTSDWVMIDYKTECAAYPTVYYNDFETNFNCWVSYIKRTGAVVSREIDRLSNRLKINLGNSTNVDTVWLLSPQLLDLQSNTNRVRFNVKISKLNSGLVIGTGNFNSRVFHPVDTITVSNTSDYYNIIVNLTNVPAGDDRVIFTYEDGSPINSWYYIDDFYYEEQTNCEQVENVIYSSVTRTSAMLQWDSAMSSNVFEYTYFVNYGNIQNPDDFIITEISDTMVSLTGLDAGTLYSFYVRHKCATENSNWVGPISFATYCDPIVNFPWTEDFETSNDIDLPLCFTVLNENNDNDKWSIFNNSTYANSESHSVRIYTSNGGNNNDYMILPAFDLPTDNKMLLTYNYRIGSIFSPNNFQVLISTTGRNPEDFTDTLLPLTSFSNTSYQEQTLELYNYTGVVHIAFHVPQGSLDGYYIYIDDIKIADYSSCKIPNTVEINNIKTTSFTLDWSSSNVGRTNNDSLLYIYTLDNTLPANVNGILGNSSSIQVSGITQDTVWNVFVREVCSTAANDTSAWGGPIQFKTPCSSVISNFPWIEDFEGVSTPNLPDCFIWLDNLNINSTEHWESTTTNPNGASTKSAYVNTNQGKDYMILPQFNLTGDEKLVYWVRNSATSSVTNYAILVSTDGVGVNDFTDTIFTQSLTGIGSDVYRRKIVNLDKYTGNIFIAFYIPQGSSGQLYIDDITVKPCLTISDIRDTVFCKGDAFSLDINISNYESDTVMYLWENGSTDSLRTISTSGTYWAQISDNNRCSATDTFKITESEVVVNIVSTTTDTVPFGGSITIDAGNAGTGNSFIWNTRNTTQTIDVLHNGKEGTTTTYSVTVTNKYNCTGIDTIKIFNDVSVGIDNLGAIVGDIKAYPNPTKDQVMLDITSYKSGRLKVEIYSLKGSLVDIVNSNITSGHQLVPINLSEMVSGVYIMDIKINEIPVPQKVRIIKL